MHTPKNLFLVNFSLILFIFFNFNSAQAAENNAAQGPKFVSQVELNAKKGITGKKKFKRDIGRLGFVMPFFQNNRSVAFATVIGMADTNKAIEGNFGAGYRVLYTRSTIIGGYLFYDLRRTPSKNTVHQVTIGAEFMKANMECRANIYLPISKQKPIKDYDMYNVHYNGIKTTVKADREKVSEVVMHGFDIEFGGSLPALRKLNGFLAFYHFGHSNKKVKSMNGIRLRTNYSFTNWFALEGECSRDKVAGFVSYLGLKFSWSPAAHNSGANAARKIINKKMTQLPVRDIDANTAQIDESQLLFIKEANGKAIPYIKAVGDRIRINSNITVARTIEEVNALKDGEANNIWLIDEEGISVLGLDNDENSVKDVSGDDKYRTKKADSKKRAKFNIGKLNVKKLKQTKDSAGVVKQDALKTVVSTKMDEGKITFEQSIDNKYQNPSEAVASALKECREKKGDLSAADSVITRARNKNVSDKDISAGVMSMLMPDSVDEYEKTGEMFNPKTLNEAAKHLNDEHGIGKNDFLDGVDQAMAANFNKIKPTIADLNERRKIQAGVDAKSHHMAIAEMALDAQNSEFTEVDLYNSNLKTSMVAGAIIQRKHMKDNKDLKTIFAEERARNVGVTNVQLARGALESMEDLGPYARFKGKDIVNAQNNNTGITKVEALTAGFGFLHERKAPLAFIGQEVLQHLSGNDINYNEFKTISTANGVQSQTVVNKTFEEALKAHPNGAHEMIKNGVSKMNIDPTEMARAARANNVPKNKLLGITEITANILNNVYQGL